jgi:hypothetical protein
MPTTIINNIRICLIHRTTTTINNIRICLIYPTTTISISIIDSTLALCHPHHLPVPARLRFRIEREFSRHRIPGRRRQPFSNSISNNRLSLPHLPRRN